MNGTPEGYIQRLVEISKKKMDCLKSILSLTRAQTEAISEEGMDGLQSLIDQSRVKLMKSTVWTKNSMRVLRR